VTDNLKIVFTDLDGTLLDHHTYSYEKSMPGIELLKKEEIPLVLVSSKTRPEMEGLHTELDLNSPLIFENGAGISYPMNGSGKYKIELNGQSVEELTDNIDLLKKLLGFKIKTILEMDIDEIVSFTGLSKEKAKYSTMRVASLPFIIPDNAGIGLEKIDEINSELAGNGLRLTKGGRFYHFSSVNANKGFAVNGVKEYYRELKHPEKLISCCMGDSENDIAMMRHVDHPFLVRKHDGSHIDTGTVNTHITESIGPEGFAEAVRIFLKQ
jgi:mannosyl-3-phosphoglycerate phosphatase